MPVLLLICRRAHAPAVVHVCHQLQLAAGLQVQLVVAAGEAVKLLAASMNPCQLIGLRQAHPGQIANASSAQLDLCKP